MNILLLAGDMEKYHDYFNENKELFQIAHMEGVKAIPSAVRLESGVPGIWSYTFRQRKDGE